MMAGSKSAALGLPVRLVSSALDTSTGTTISFSSTTLGDIGVLLLTADVASVTGWTKIESGTVGSLFVKEMTAGETSATFSASSFAAVVSFFRGALLPTTSNSADFSGSSAAPNPPTAPISVGRFDVVWVGGVSSSSVASASISSGYTLIQQGNNSWGVGCGYLAGQTGLPDPGAFGWSTAGDCNGFTLVLKKA